VSRDPLLGGDLLERLNRLAAEVHYHLLLFVPPSFGSVVELRQFVASSWYEVCGKLGEGHLLAGTYVEEVRSWRRATSHMERYVAKPEEFPEG
jgi:hypothetical protein